jgi:hypothetical protein
MRPGVIVPAVVPADRTERRHVEGTAGGDLDHPGGRDDGQLLVHVQGADLRRLAAH